MSPLLLLLSIAHAGDVLVPTITPQTMSDFGPAERLTEATLAALAERDVIFVAPSEIQRRAGDVADGCADEPECTDILWRHFPPARLAIVGSITWKEGQLESHVRFYGPEDNSPIEVMTATFAEAGIDDFAQQVAFFTEELLPLIPPRDGAALVVAAEPEQPAPPPPSVAQPPPPEAASVQEDPRADDRERRLRGLPRNAWAQYKASGKEFKDWKDDAMVRAGSVIIEVYGGATFGDVDRRYDARVELIQDGDSFNEGAGFQQESFMTGSAFSAGGSIGYVPVWFLEADLSGGIQLGHKQLTTGWAHINEDELVDESVKEWAPAIATMAVLEPKLRFHFLATGPVKPFLLAATTLRFYDGYTIPDDNAAATYPDREGGVSLGMTAGGGVAFDAPRGAVGFIEVPWTYLITPEPYSSNPDGYENPPASPVSSGQLLTFRAGVGARF